MTKINRDKRIYLKQNPQTEKWLNHCLICNCKGYKPELPEKIHPGYLAEHIREYFQPLVVNEISICEQCQIHWKH